MNWKLPDALSPTRIDNPDGTCAYRGCGKLATTVRITRLGFFWIDYCAIHEHQASDLFDVERFEEVA